MERGVPLSNPQKPRLSHVISPEPAPITVVRSLEREAPRSPARFVIAETAFVVQCVFVGPTVTVFVGEITVYTACGVFGVSLIGIRVVERTAHILSPRIVERGFESQVLDNIPSQIRIRFSWRVRVWSYEFCTVFMGLYG